MQKSFLEHTFCNPRIEENRCIVGLNPLKDNIFIKEKSIWNKKKISDVVEQISDKTSNTAISNYFHHNIELNPKNDMYKEACKVPIGEGMVKEISIKNKILLNKTL